MPTCAGNRAHDGGGSIVFAKSEVWEEIARRVEIEGHTPLPDIGQD